VAADRDKLLSTTAYLLPTRSSLCARLLAALRCRRNPTPPAGGGGGAAAAAGAEGWLPLWSWDVVSSQLTVWDYDLKKVTEAAAGRDVTFPPASPASSKGPQTSHRSPPHFTLQTFACGDAASVSGGGGGRVAALKRALGELQGQAEEAAADAYKSLRPLRIRPAGAPLVVAHYSRGGAAVGVSVRRAAAVAHLVIGSRPAEIDARAAVEAASLEMHLDVEPPSESRESPGCGSGCAPGCGTTRRGRGGSGTRRALPPQQPASAMGAITVDFGAGAAPTAVRMLHGGSHSLALLFSATSSVVRDAKLPEWVLEQLELADRATAASARSTPAVAALLRNAQGEQWLLCCDALATASIGANLGRLWPRAPQGLRCFYSRGSLMPSARERQRNSGGSPLLRSPPGGLGPGERPQAAGRGPSGAMGFNARRMRFQDSLQPLTTLEEVEAGPSGIRADGLSDVSEIGLADDDMTVMMALSGGEPTQDSSATGRGGVGSRRTSSAGSAAGVAGSKRGSVTSEGLAAAAAVWAHQSALPHWLVVLLDRVAVPWTASAEASPWWVPDGVTLGDAGGDAEGGLDGRCVAHVARLPDTGLNRVFLWWVWNQGSDGMRVLLAPPPPPPTEAAAGEEVGAGAVRSALRRAGAAVRGALACGRRKQAGGEGVSAGDEKADGGRTVTKERHQLSPVLDGLLTTLLEEHMLRSEPLLSSYWSAYESLDGAGCRAVRERDVGLVQVSGGWMGLLGGGEGAL